MLPETLDGWTLDVVRVLLEQGVFETDRFDFKEKLPHKADASDKLRLLKTCTAFANSGGGFLIFGVKDEKDLTADERLIGIDATDDFPERFGNFPASVEPSVDWAFANPAPPLVTGRVLHVVHILASPRRPHGVLDAERWWFCKRTNKGNESMSYTELQAAFVARKEKLAKLSMLITELKHIRDTAYATNVYSFQNRASGWVGSVTAYDYSVASALILDIADLLSYDEALLGLLPRLREAVLEAEAVRTSPLLSQRDLVSTKMAAKLLGDKARAVHQLIVMLLPLLERAQERNPAQHKGA